MSECGQVQRQQYQQEEQQKYVYHQNSEGQLFVKVMTDEQMEVLRQQISLYASICESLVDTHRHLSEQQDLIGMKLGMGSLYSESLMRFGHKHTAKQRWTPTPAQLKILEQIFDEGNGTIGPNKQEIKDITAQLSQHGQISETNVYNWFQNRRARSKRKPPVYSTDKELDSSITKSLALEQSAPIVEDRCLRQIPEIGNDILSVDAISSKEELAFPLDCGLTCPTASGHPTSSIILSPKESASPGIDYLLAKVEVPGDFISFWQEEYDMLG